MGNSGEVVSRPQKLPPPTEGQPEAEAPPQWDPGASRKPRFQEEPRKHGSPDVTSDRPFRPQVCCGSSGANLRGPPATLNWKVEGFHWRIHFPLLPLETGPAWKAALLGPQNRWQRIQQRQPPEASRGCLARRLRTGEDGRTGVSLLHVAQVVNLAGSQAN